MVRCSAITAKGSRCRNQALRGRKTCASHVGAAQHRPATSPVVKCDGGVCRLVGTAKTASAHTAAELKSYARRFVDYDPTYSFNPEDAKMHEECRQFTPSGRYSRIVDGGSKIIPTRSEYISRFPSEERRKKAMEYDSMSGCQLAAIAKTRRLAKAH